MNLLEFYGIPHKSSGDNAETQCLSCGSNSLSISTTGNNVFQCWKCKQEGNAYTLIRMLYDSLPDITFPEAKTLSQKKKGIPPVAFKLAGIKLMRGNYMIPVYGHKGNLLSLHKYNPANNIVYSPPKPVTCTVLGMQHMKGTEDLFVCEGHWDYLCLTAQMSKVKDHPDIIGTCGSSFASTYMTLLEDKNVYLLFDNDEAGMNGVTYLARRMKSSGVQCASLQYLDWDTVTLPNHTTVPDKFDIRDLVNALHT